MKRYFVKIINNQNLIDFASISEIKLLGFHEVKSITKHKIYSICGDIGIKQVNLICEQLLVDPVIEQYQVNKVELIKNVSRVNIWYKEGVLDVVANNICKGVKYLDIKTPLEVHCGTQITFIPKIGLQQIDKILKKVFINELIEEYKILK